MSRTLSRIAAVAVLVAAVGVGTTLTSSAAPGSSQVSVVHGIPGVDVDVYVAGSLTLADFAPKDVAGPLTLDPGDYRVEIFAHVPNPPATAADRGDAAVIDETETVPADANVSLVANITNTGALTVTAFVNDVGPTASGDGRVIVRHTANAPTVDIQVAGADALPDLAYGAQLAADLPAGSYDVGVQVAPDGPVVLSLPGVAVTAGQVLIVYAIGDATAQPATLDVAVQTVEVGQQTSTTTTVSPTSTTAPATTPTTVSSAATPAAAVSAVPAYAG